MMNNMLIIQQNNQAKGPADSKNQRTRDRKIPPRNTDNRMDLTRSVKKSLGVVLLNPNFSSMTNVE
jgi:hypothetical protein